MVHFVESDAQILGYTGLRIVQSSSAKIRPNDTTTYASGDVINESTSAGTGLTFTGCGRPTVGSGVIMEVRITDSANQTLKLSAELWLFTAAPAADNDNAAFTPSDAETLTLACPPIPVVYSYIGDATSGAGGNVVLSSGRVDIPFACASGSATLYGVLVARNAYVPVTSEVFTVNLFIAQN